jgi:hypothetical protein
MPQYNERWETSARQRLPTTLDTMDCVTRDKYRRRSSRLCHDQGGPVKRRLKFPQGCAIEARALRRLIACSGKSTNQDVVWLRRGLSASEILTALVAVSGSILPMIKKTYAISDCKRPWACIFAMTKRLGRTRLRHVNARTAQLFVFLTNNWLDGILAACSSHRPTHRNRPRR